MIAIVKIQIMAAKTPAHIKYFIHKPARILFESINII